MKRSRFIEEQKIRILKEAEGEPVQARFARGITSVKQPIAIGKTSTAEWR
jgi:hypothetical protein